MNVIDDFVMPINEWIVLSWKKNVLFFLNILKKNSVEKKNKGQNVFFFKHYEWSMGARARPCQLISCM